MCCDYIDLCNFSWFNCKINLTLDTQFPVNNLYFSRDTRHGAAGAMLSDKTNIRSAAFRSQ